MSDWIHLATKTVSLIHCWLGVFSQFVYGRELPYRDGGTDER